MKWFEDLEKAMRIYEELKNAQGEDKRFLLERLKEIGASDRLLTMLGKDLEGEWTCEKETT